MTLRSLIWLILLFIVAVAVAVLGHFEKSYVILIYSPYRIDISLQSLLVLLPIGLTLLYGLIRFLRFISLIPQRSISIYRSSREQTALKELCEAINFTFSGCYLKAEKAAERAAKCFFPEKKLNKHKPRFAGIKRLLSSATVIQAYSAASLIGAKAALGQNNHLRSKAWLEQIKEDKWLEARYLLEAENYLKVNDLSLAMVSLNQFYELGGKSLAANHLAWQIAQQQKNWHAMRLHLSLLKQHKFINLDSIDNLNLIAARQLLLESQTNVDDLNKAWNELNSDEKQNIDLLKIFINALLNLQHKDQARQIIENALNNKWQPELLPFYIKSVASAPLEMIQQVENWLQIHAQDAYLLYTQGQLCAKQKIWGKAKLFFDQALGFSKHNIQLQKKIYSALGEIHENLNEVELAHQNFRASVLLEDNL